ncbi:MAG: hypothetical protein GMKNLPBB_00473 [Myxococcota bacterium]|nr:hypothetical protein [Myxococcota bacterium]
MAQPFRLITIKVSHYCEKVRWALDRLGFDYVEEAHPPLFSALASKLRGGGRTVPVLLTGDRVLKDSTEILHYLDERAGSPGTLYPADIRKQVEDLEEQFDKDLGPAARRLVYYHILDRKDLTLPVLLSGTGAAEQRLFRMVFPQVRELMRKGLKINAEGAERSIRKLEAVFAGASELLKDGRRYLTGDRLTAADITFASLAAPVLRPDNHGSGIRLMSTPPEDLARVIEPYRQSPAGQFALRLYREERGAMRGKIA